MISFWADRHQKSCFAKRAPLSFFTNLFKRKKYKINRYGNGQNLEDSPSASQRARVPTALSVSVMDMRMVSQYPLSPALSTLTLTPGRTRDIDQDMEALRLSRQDNPFLQVLASRESLVDSLFESDLDDTNLMTQDGCYELDVDPLSLPEIHEHMIRSPPPTTWPKSPNFKVFKFPGSDEPAQRESGYVATFKSPVCLLSPRQSHSKVRESTSGALRDEGHKPHQRSSSECRHRSIQGDPVGRYSGRSLSDVRRAPTTLQLQRLA